MFVLRLLALSLILSAGFLLPTTEAKNPSCPYETSISTVQELLLYLSQKGDMLSWLFGDLRYVGNWTEAPGAAGASNSPCVAECLACSTSLVFLKRFIEKNVPLSEIMAQLLTACDSKGLKTPPEVCKGYIESNAPTLLWVMAQTMDFDPDLVCAMFLGIPRCNGDEIPDATWLVPIPDDKPQRKPIVLPENPVSVEMLHITDMHWDPEYVENSEGNCNAPLCCRKESTLAPNKTKSPAGKWGDYKCDTPMEAIIEMFAEIRTRHARLELVIFTGDIPPHDVWGQTRRFNSELTQDATLKLLKGSFQDLPVFPVLGNHEAFPPNLFSFRGLGIPLGLSTDYIYNLAWELWRDWLPPDQEENVRRGSFYSVIAKPGLRIISINTHYCFKLNWFIWAGTPDPNGQLTWLISELHKAEKAGEVVYIIGHIPPGNHECMPIWSHNYARIINRFENTIKGQFFGHTHHDEFAIYRDPQELRRATNVAFVTPSITAYRKVQPSYRVFHLDGRRWESSWSILDHETWVYNLAEANKKGQSPKWVQLYSMKDHYRMPNLQPQSFLNLTMGPIRSDPKVWESYHRFFWSDSPVSPPCDQQCRRKHLCMVLNPDTSWALFCLG